MNIQAEYFKVITASDSLHDFCSQTQHFLKSKNERIHLLSHHVGPNPLTVLESSNNLPYWYDKLQAMSLDSDDIQQHDGTYTYFFSSLNFRNEEVFIFITESQNEIATNILPFWQSAAKLIFNCTNLVALEKRVEYGNYISQLLHDVSALIGLNDSKNSEFLEKIEYQKKVNRNLLFLIRDLDLFRTPIAVKDLVHDSLKLVGVDFLNLDISFEKPDYQINIDVELIANAFNEIIKNALYHVKDDYSLVSVKAYMLQSPSPFIKFNWLVLEIKDKGGGIPADFLARIKNPFFTTEKHHGFSGFGLSNAEKIVKAHGGIIEIESKKETNIKLYIPEIPYE